jgi:hypothetical protein
MKALISQVNNSRELRKKISALLGKSDCWLVLRSDVNGIHAHMPNEEHLFVLAEFLRGNPDIYDMVTEFIKDTKN